MIPECVDASDPRVKHILSDDVGSDVVSVESSSVPTLVEKLQAALAESLDAWDDRNEGRSSYVDDRVAELRKLLKVKS